MSGTQLLMSYKDIRSSLLTLPSESIHATTLPAENPMDKPYYIPPRTGYVSTMYRLSSPSSLAQQCCILRLHDAPPEGPLGTRWCDLLSRVSRANVLCSRRIRARPLPRCPAQEVHPLKPVHLPSLQRWSSDLPRAAVRVQRDLIYACSPFTELFLV